ncbi:MAG TPA: hypothetical protein VMQ58_01875 [Candidatus Saccharimonadales bacterium]|nr:hypothetical protein [Candidatus Saccharimonadales bacterium]
MNWNKFKNAKWFAPLILGLIAIIIVGGVMASNAWNSANLHGTGIVTVTTTTTPVAASFSGTITSDSLSIGTVATGATLNIGGVVATEHTLGIASPSVTNIAPSSYGFKLQADSTQQAALVTYFGTMGGNSTYVTDIGNEINGTLPFFFLNISGSTVNIYDGFQDQLGNHTAPLVINDTYPVGVYTYTGTLTGANGATNLPVTVTLTVVEPAVWEIGTTIVTGNPTVTLAFGSPTVAAGAPISVTATLSVTNIGSATITGWNLTNVVYPSTGTGWNLTVVPTASSIATGATTTLTFTLTGTAPSGSASINLNGVSCTLTPSN